MTNRPLLNGESTDSPRDTLASRIIEPSEFVADTEAFVDVRLERSKGKASYSFIGPGVSQNPNQVINLMVPHGFNVGAATLPHGVINNPHLHFTAEVFICTRGSFRFDIGEHGEQSVEVNAGDVFSVPTWVFRGFENTGADDGWMFAVLGGNDTGGIIWAPHILAEAAETGMYLGKDYALLDATAGDDVSRVVEPLTSEELAGHTAQYSDADLAAHAARFDDLNWSPRALLSGAIPGHDCSMAPVIGHGLTQCRSQRPPITHPHGFSIEWLQVEPGASTGMHRHDHSQATLLIEGNWTIEMMSGATPESAQPAEGSIVSIPNGAWRNFTNHGEQPARALIVCGSDSPTRLEWSKEIVDRAGEAGSVIDASGFVAPSHLAGGAS